VRSVGIYDMLVIQFKSTDESNLQFRKKVKRAAQECHAAADGLTAGKA
jgi:hypothetical protein